MKEKPAILGPAIGKRDMDGRREARVGTVFLLSNGVVTTTPSTHAMQRTSWRDALNKNRAANGLPSLTEREVEDEVRHSVDLLFDDRHVLIRPEPQAMDQAFEADELLQTQKLVSSKREIRYLNTQNKTIRDALRARGENWRMSRLPVSPIDMNMLIASSVAALGCEPIYFYNQSTGTRFLTLGRFASLDTLPDEAFRKQFTEIIIYSDKRNRFWNLEVDIFPQGCAFTRQAFKSLNADSLTIDELRAVYRRLLDDFRQAVPADLHDENTGNIEWRNELCSALTVQPNAVETEILIQGISSEFYRQIKWLPGCRIENGELIFDPIFDELEADPGNAELQAICDPRAKAIIFNYIRECSTIEYINIGCIEHSLSSTRPTNTQRYIVQLKEASKPEPELRILRFQKWGVKEHLDEGRNLLDSIMLSMDYTDYVLDRRLGSRQLGMNLSGWLATGRIEETYGGMNCEYCGSRCWTVYFERAYVPGEATDKIPPNHYANPEFNRRFARLLGEAAAVNCIVGRADEQHGKQVIFDDGDEVIACNAGMPESLIVSDHTGAFTQWEEPLARDAEAYAAPVNRRVAHMLNATEFAGIYLGAFQTRFEQVQQEYKNHKTAFDRLFGHRPVDAAGSFAYRWEKILARLSQTDAAELTRLIRSHINPGTPSP